MVMLGKCGHALASSGNPGFSLLNLFVYFFTPIIKIQNKQVFCPILTDRPNLPYFTLLIYMYANIYLIISNTIKIKYILAPEPLVEPAPVKWPNCLLKSHFGSSQHLPAGFSL